MFFKTSCSNKCSCRCDYQRYKKTISACHLSNKEYCSKRGMHNSGHHTCHSNQHEPVIRQVNVCNLFQNTCKQISVYASYEQSRCKDPSHSSCAICRTACYNLKKNKSCHKKCYHKKTAGKVTENAVINNHVRFSLKQQH